MSGHEVTAEEIFDVAVIGAGLIGCALARRFTLDGARVVVLEKAADVLDGASKGNSGILHTGFDAPPGSLEARCIQAGHEEYLDIRERLNLPVDRCGALVIAWTAEEETLLPALMQQAQANGIDDIEPLDAASTRRLEPGLASSVRASFRVPRESLIDPWSAPHAYLLQALLNGATLLRNCEVKGGGFEGGSWSLATALGEVRSRFVVNAAGLYGDRVDALLLGRTDFTIRPRKGQFVVFDKAAAALARHILLPVPSQTTKGIVVCRTIYGNLLVGPTAEDQDDRTEARLVPETLRALAKRGAEILPALAGLEPTAIYAGLRPATEHKDYRIRHYAHANYLTVGGIRSTGLSSALGTARYARELVADAIANTAALRDPIWPQMANISEIGTRDFENPGNGGVVCHCEGVTRREIETVLSDPMAPNALGGLKRRTRVTMGRCQGFYCLAELAAITRGRLAEPMALFAEESADAP